MYITLEIIIGLSLVPLNERLTQIRRAISMLTNTFNSEVIGLAHGCPEVVNPLALANSSRMLCTTNPFTGKISANTLTLHV